MKRVDPSHRTDKGRVRPDRHGFNAKGQEIVVNRVGFDIFFLQE
jgi:hypothetical protein